MAGYIICLTSGSGLPVFTRSAGNVKNLPFPVIGSLNAVHMFAANHNTVLKSTTTEDARIVWKEFEKSLVLIAVQTLGYGESEDAHVEHLLDNVFASIVLLHGLDDIKNIKNVERFKKEIRICYQLVDVLLQQSHLHIFCDVTNAVDIVLTNDSSILQNFLDAFTEACTSTYGCLLVHGRVVSATPCWWQLSSQELVLLQLLLHSFPPCTSRDVPVYLPQLSPSVPHRLLTFELIQNVEVCVICGPTPPLASLEREVERFWVPARDILYSLLTSSSRCIPSRFEVDANILGMLLVNTDRHRCLSCVDFHLDGQDKNRLEMRRSILRAFFKQVIGTYFTSSIEGTDKVPSQFSHQATDTYIVSTNHKCYAHKSGPHLILILYSSKIPTFSMRSVTKKTLQMFVKEKSAIL